jgi:CheY-like chemotaxis protein
MTSVSILIVDDQPVNVELAKFLLVLEGYAVHTAPDAETALRLLPELRPQLILMDVQLPGMDGLELTRRIKADPVYSQTVVLALTAYAMKGDQDKALAAGCDGYLAKPIDTRTFPSEVARYLQRQRTHKEDKR